MVETFHKGDNSYKREHYYLKNNEKVLAIFGLCCII
jgi:hypothetical protein